MLSSAVFFCIGVDFENIVDIVNSDKRIKERKFEYIYYRRTRETKRLCTIIQMKRCAGRNPEE